MNSKRIREIQNETAYPNSVSVQQALLKVWNECEQEKVVNKNIILSNIDKRCIYTELETMGYSKQQILELLGFMERLPIHQTTEAAKKVSVILAKGHVVII